MQLLGLLLHLHYLEDNIGMHQKCCEKPAKKTMNGTIIIQPPIHIKPLRNPPIIPISK